jgi:hypothetical protein
MRKKVTLRRRARKNAATPQLFPRTCTVCKEKFHPVRPQARTCGARCRKRLSRMHSVVARVSAKRNVTLYTEIANGKAKETRRPRPRHRRKQTAAERRASSRLAKTSAVVRAQAVKTAR